MEWYSMEFPQMDAADLQRYLTAYEACTMCEEFLTKNKWEALSVLEALRSQSCPGLGEHATRFFSYSRASPVLDVLLAMFGNVRTYSPGALWFFDIVNVRQAVEGDCKPEVVEEVIANVGHTVLMLHPLRDPAALHRLWCVYEVVSTTKAKATLSCALEACNVDSDEGFVAHAKRAVETTASAVADLRCCKIHNLADGDAIRQKLAAAEGKEEEGKDVMEQMGNLVQAAVRDTSSGLDDRYRALCASDEFFAATYD
eukprot:TRINITY_DN16911_c0_g1_i2.p1 TRINITY_DN16911_c0_g1~~TRINITY_DN16911_c0_g1_i2.p1  ORF type:complete len:256 (+),score=46.48 TRINITY_DN16911_c0_g1_i2:765-1532(+)